MDYKIIDFNEQLGVISILYSDGISINFDLPITDGQYPDAITLDTMIQNVYPVDYANRLNDAKAVANLDDIRSKIEAPSAPDLSNIDSAQVDPVTNAADIEKEMLLREEITSIVKEVLLNLGVIK